jgi:hypothetical protein
MCLLTFDVVKADEQRFTDVTIQAGTGGPTERGRLGGHGAMFADVDDDGRVDLYVTMIFNNLMPDLFFRNLDGRRFANEGTSRGIADFDGGSHGACFADLDNDGDYDLVNGTTWDHRDYPSAWPTWTTTATWTCCWPATTWGISI